MLLKHTRITRLDQLGLQPAHRFDNILIKRSGWQRQHSRDINPCSAVGRSDRQCRRVVAEKRGSKECLAQIFRTSCCDCDTMWVGIRHPLGFFDLACRFLPSSSSIQVLFGAKPTISSPKQLSYSCQRQENESSRYFYQMRPPGRSESRSPHALTQQLTL